MTERGRVVIAGGSGFLGQSLARYLTRAGHDVVVLSRRATSAVSGARQVRWDARSVGEWWRELDGAAALVNLTGRSVDCVKTPERCDEILRSRVESTRALGRALARVSGFPPIWVQMSTAHIYGDPPDLICDEDSALGCGLAPSIGRDWEEALAQAAPPGIRTVVLRTSFVLGRSGGALPRLVTLARLGLGGRVGTGRQGISWIHELDMNRLFERAILDNRMSGAYVATAPHPVSNAAFMRELRRALGVPIGLPASGWMVRLAAPILLRTDPDLALYGRNCVSRRLRDEGFEFRFPVLPAALQDLWRRYDETR